MRKKLEEVHDNMHGFVFMGGPHISFRDPFVFLLHSNVDRLFARWQTDPAHPKRLNPNTVYGTESNLDVPVVSVIQNLNHNVEPWSTGHSFDQFGEEHFTRPWYAPENKGVPHSYKDPSVVSPPLYDTNHFLVPDCTGQDLAGAQRVLTKAELKLGATSTEFPGFPPVGGGSFLSPPLVINQNPKPRVQVSSGTAVNLTMKARWVRK